MERHLTVLITGATSGFGEAMARLFVQHGHRVILSGRRRERLDRLAGDLGSQSHPVPLDVRDEAAVNAAIAGLPPEFADIDVLVNNAGLALGLEPAQEAHITDWRTMVETNINGLMFCTRAVLPGMVSRGRGHVVNIGSVAGTYPYPGGNVYGATKAFVHQFSLNLRSDLLGKNVRVTCVEPGLAETEFSLIRFKGDEAKAKTPYRGVKPMTGDDIAAAVYFAVTLPEHVNINVIEMMATNQAFAPFAIHRA